MLFPGIGDAGEDGDPGACILAAFGVVGREGVEGARPVDKTLALEGVEVGCLVAKAQGVGAHLVTGDESIVTVEGGIFDTFGHQRPRVLL